MVLFISHLIEIIENITVASKELRNLLKIATIKNKELY